MDKLEIAKYLLEDSINEINYSKKYTQEVDNARAKDDWNTIYRMRVPSQQRIKDNLKMIRRISLEIERGNIFEQ